MQYDMIADYLYEDEQNKDIIILINNKKYWFNYSRTQPGSLYIHSDMNTVYLYMYDNHPELDMIINDLQSQFEFIQ